MHIKTIKMKKPFRITCIHTYNTYNKFGAFGYSLITNTIIHHRFRDREAFEIPFVTLNLFVTDCWLLNII